MKKILITGVAGFIGFHAAKYELENGNYVIGVDNLDNYYDVRIKKDRLDILKKQAQIWSTDEIKNIIYKVNNLETLIKKNSGNSMLFVSNFVSNY